MTDVLPDDLMEALDGLPKSRVFRTVVAIEVFAMVEEGVAAELHVAPDTLLVPKGNGRAHASKFDPEADVRDAVAGADVGPDIGVYAGESKMTVIEEWSRVA